MTEDEIFQKAFDLYDQGMLEESIKFYTKYIELKPDHSSTPYYNRGNAYGSLGENEKAVADFDEADRLGKTQERNWVKK